VQYIPVRPLFRHSVFNLAHFFSLDALGINIIDELSEAVGQFRFKILVFLHFAHCVEETLDDSEE
jgi:hypothetical protein